MAVATTTASASEPEFANNTLRVRNQPALAARIEAVTSEQPRAHWLALLEANDIPCGPINNYAQVFADPHLVAREMAVDAGRRCSASTRKKCSPRTDSPPARFRRSAPPAQSEDAPDAPQIVIRVPSKRVNENPSKFSL